MLRKEMSKSPTIFRFFPTHGDSRYLGTGKGARPVDRAGAESIDASAGRARLRLSPGRVRQRYCRVRPPHDWFLYKMNTD
jgi:hypothetical protein